MITREHNVGYDITHKMDVDTDQSDDLSVGTHAPKQT